MVVFLIYLNMVFVVKNITRHGCAVIVEAKGGWIMLVVYPPPVVKATPVSKLKRV